MKYSHFKAEYKVMLNNSAAQKYETPYTGPFVMMRFLTNVTVNIQHGLTHIRYNIPKIKPYKSDANIEYHNTAKCVMI